MTQFLVLIAYITVGLNPLNMGAITTRHVSADIEFTQPSSIEVGSLVVHSGKAVGKVVEVRVNDAGKNSRTVRIALQADHSEVLTRGTIALITSPLPAYEKPRESVIELITAAKKNSPALAEGEKLSGFASFKEFWTAPSSS